MRQCPTFPSPPPFRLMIPVASHSLPSLPSGNKLEGEARQSCWIVYKHSFSEELSLREKEGGGGLCAWEKKTCRFRWKKGFLTGYHHDNHASTSKLLEEHQLLSGKRRQI
ncbi:hypothetical protein CEXT_114161 [Caerostris extrusa]|uniref:Uncharacterized protein n=1 Tax=Caerostris extrusa TaxID=172846 RepID=A0AAV4S0H6_CAEEX|nr:hypothetical protein CEXT_114161 [Caerostris extrusa]